MGLKKATQAMMKVSNAIAQSIYPVALDCP